MSDCDAAPRPPERRLSALSARPSSSSSSGDEGSLQASAAAAAALVAQAQADAYRLAPSAASPPKLQRAKSQSFEAVRGSGTAQQHGGGALASPPSALRRQQSLPAMSLSPVMA